jgi:serine-type D-Ala-D-Ala carboxypeptidase/endopeptidase (penicillin-binding protein 4)
MRTRIFAIFSFLISVFSSFAQTDFKTELQKLLQKPEYKNATVGIQIMDLESEKPLFELNADKLMIPASTLKLLTSATALEILGADYHFQTKIGYTGDLLQTNEIKGDLIVLGGGDPTLGSEYFNQFESCRDFVKIWVQKIKAVGIHKITGDIIFDGSVYNSEKIPPTWIWGDIGNYYGAGASAFTCYDNLFRITFKSSKEVGEKTEIVQQLQKLKDLKL